MKSINPKTEVIRQSENYPKYWMIRRSGQLHLALKYQHKDCYDEGDEFLSCGTFSHEEDFETLCDQEDETFRETLSCLGM